MINVKCSTGDALSVTEMTPFQGELKKRTDKDIDAMTASLDTDGLLMPFAIWRSEGKNYIIDGHGRYQAVTKMCITRDAALLQQRFPVLFIDAETEAAARNALLQITSTYGKVSKGEVIKFAAPVVNCTAPVLKAAVPKIKTELRARTGNKVVIKLNVHKDKVEALLKLLRQVDGVEVAG